MSVGGREEVVRETGNRRVRLTLALSWSLPREKGKLVNLAGPLIVGHGVS